MTTSAVLTEGSPLGAFRAVLKSQYHAGLAMLRQTIDQCPEELWSDDEPVNAFWQVAYHALYFTHLYLQPDEAFFRPWPGHQPDVQHEDGIAGTPDPASDLPLIPRPYTKEQTLAYWQFCDDMVDDAVAALDLQRPTSGFSWYRVSKLEHQIINLRHLQHRLAQLADRLRSKEGVGTRWVAARRVTADEFPIPITPRSPMMTFSSTMRSSFLRELESVRREIEAYSDESLIWSLPPGVPNSAGTLALHIAGNLQHYFGAVLGGTAYIRDRPAEFSTRDVSRSELLVRIAAAEAAVAGALDASTQLDLAQPFSEPLGGAALTTAEVIIHLAVHLAYHLGQIDYHRRLVTGDPAGINAVDPSRLASRLPPGASSP
ncbi:MAG: DUF664 domain-containing protein [Gemmatimonas sp.]|nr:DUF664 domain-containing protein [Gemmatimonas sp.]